MKNLTHTKIINEIIENVRYDMQDEEIIHLVLEKTVALPDGKDETLGQKIPINSLVLHSPVFSVTI